MFSLFNFFSKKEKTEDLENLFEYLIVITPGKTVAENFASQYKKLLRKAHRKGHKVLFKLYLSWEDYILNKKAQMGEAVDKVKFRSEIGKKIDVEKLDEEFRIIFLEERDQILHLYENLVQKLGQYIKSNMGFRQFQSIVAEAGKNTVFENIEVTKEKIDFSHFNSLIRSNPAEYPTQNITKIFKTFVEAFYSKIETALGEKVIQTIFQKLYDHMRETYSAEFATHFLKITPEKILGLDQWLSVLSKEELEKQVKQKTTELEELNESLEERVNQRTRELQKAYQELKELDKKKSDFISVAAHQIRTPLSGIKWILNMLLEDGEDNHLSTEQKDFLNKANEANEKLLLIVNDMLDTDLVATGKAVYDFKQTDCIAIIQQVVSDLTPQANIKNIKLTSNDKSNKNGIIEADAKRIKTVIQNLMDNAIKYSPNESEVKIETDKTFDNFIIKVIDQGIGIPEDQKVDIFKRFFRAQNSIRTHANGSGLGLFIAQSVILEHHGRIDFESTENKGTTFTIILPLKQPR
ncbi:HAMP domain-containing histidine kinase [Candidatus Nomurabacteria bacterium]|nr:HAMP domain-containing histidine kinase [Candidatus Nomurabacteria bacterium]